MAVMERDALRMRDGGPFVFAQVCWTIRSPVHLIFWQFFIWMTGRSMDGIFLFVIFFVDKNSILCCNPGTRTVVSVVNIGSILGTALHTFFNLY